MVPRAAESGNISLPARAAPAANGWTTRREERRSLLRSRRGGGSTMVPAQPDASPRRRKVRCGRLRQALRWQRGVGRVVTPGVSHVIPLARVTAASVTQRDWTTGGAGTAAHDGSAPPVRRVPGGR